MLIFYLRFGESEFLFHIFEFFGASKIEYRRIHILSSYRVTNSDEECSSASCSLEYFIAAPSIAFSEMYAPNAANQVTFIATSRQYPRDLCWKVPSLVARNSGSAIWKRLSLVDSWKAL